MKTRVAILGGGVAGMSAAHELAERGFEVVVYEKQPLYVGGKARSVDAENTGTDGRPNLPGEHGFRFFPGFYKHITDTMKRIPFANQPNGVYDNLVMTERVLLARFGKLPISTIVNFPRNRSDVKALIQAVQHADLGLTKDNEELFADKIWQLLTSSYERRQQVYERIGWWQYMETDLQCGNQDPCAYEAYCVGGLTHSLVAAQPKLMSTKTGGDILLQLMLLMASPEAKTDRVLNGPTNEVWLFPWLKYLQGMGVQYHHNHSVQEFLCDTRKITGVVVKDLATQEEKTIQADYYIGAVPLERMAGLVNKHMLAVDETLTFLKELSQKHMHSLNWMNGIQYYLNQDVPLNKGHIIFIDSPWAITAISQVQFWPGFNLSQYGSGQARGLLSVDVSDWFNPGLNGKMAQECTLAEIIDEVWNQMEKSLNINGQQVLDRRMIVASHIDSDITEEARKAGNTTVSMHNAEPLLVNTANSWSKRPESITGLNNFFLASDYVRTYTDLATMEGANEAARRAVNGIISQSGAKAPFCKIWNLHEPDVLAVLRWLDKRRYAQGLPWTSETPWLFKILHELNYLYHKLTVFK